MSATVLVLRCNPDAYSDSHGQAGDDGLGCVRGLAVVLPIVLPFWAAIAWAACA